MIVVDTNVVSEAMKPGPLQSEAVLHWLRAQRPQAVFVTVLTIAEISAGIEVLPSGRRTSELKRAADRVFNEVFAGRVLVFDEAAAHVYGSVVAARRRAGLPIAAIDGQIAAISRVRGMRLATRNAEDFAECGVEVIDPWAA